MATVNVMYWNLGDLDQDRLAQAGASYAELIASVIRGGGIALAGFSGVLAGMGDVLGQGVVDLLARQGEPGWNQQASPPLGRGRGEQYLFVWNLGAVSAQQPDGLEYWLWQYPVPGEPLELLGFPRPQDQSPDLPPFTMFFGLNGSATWLPVSVMHAPPWELGQGQGVAAALANVCRIEALDLGNGALLMGTFNVPADDDVATADSPGAYAFTGLAGPEGKYDQKLDNHRTALCAQPVVAITDEDAYAQTGDSFFMRRNSPQGGVAGSDAGILRVISSSLGSLDAAGEWVPAPFRPALAQVEKDSTNGADPTSGPDGSYNRFDDAFAAYRL